MNSLSLGINSFTSFGTIGIGQVLVPSGFKFTLPFNVSFTGYSFVTDIDSDDYKITPTNQYYISPTGSSGNTGLTAGSPKASMDQAIALGNAAGAPYQVNVADGLYERNAPWTTTPTQDFNCIATTSAIFSQEWETKTGFTLTTNNTYVIARSDALAVFDTLTADSNGDDEKLTLAASQAACESTAGTWYTDDVDVWVHTSDNRNLAVDATDLKIMIQSGYPIVQGDIHGYIENIQFEGGGTHCFDARNTDEWQTPQLYFKNCSFKYSASGNGYNSYGVALTIMDNCVAAVNNLDGFNYHSLNAVFPNVVEIDCIGRSNGYTGASSNNGSSIHDGGNILRLNGSYFNNEGINIHDIGFNTDSLNYGVSSHTSRGLSDTSSVNFMSGDGVVGESTSMWLIECNSCGSNTDLRVEDDSFIYVNRGNVLFRSVRIIDATGTVEEFNANIGSLSPEQTNGLKAWLEDGSDTLLEDGNSLLIETDLRSRVILEINTDLLLENNSILLLG